MNKGFFTFLLMTEMIDRGCHLSEEMVVQFTGERDIMGTLLQRCSRESLGH